MLQLLQAFMREGYEITFATTATKTEFSEDLGRLGIHGVGIELNHSSFDAFVTRLDPALVVFDRFMVEEQFGWRVAENCPNAVRLLNTEDLHSLREYRESCVKQAKAFDVGDWLHTDKAKRELASCYRCDLTLLVSTFERQLLVEHLKMDENLLWHLPFLLEPTTEKTRAQWPAFGQRSGFVAYGNGKHSPNVDALTYLKTELWPKLREKLPQAQLNVFGAYLPPQVWAMNDSKTGFYVRGWVDDLQQEVKKAKVVLASLRFGAGIKGKLTLAMQCGTPSVTTRLGAEGMHGHLPWGGGLADTLDGLAQQAVTLYTNKEQWTVAQQRGATILTTHFDAQRYTLLFFERLRLLAENLHQHRKKNVIGGLLWHQSMGAAKYMGKWIQAKNRWSAGS